MEPLTLTLSLLLIAIAVTIIAYPLWRQTHPKAFTAIDVAPAPGQTREEYEARYQATLAAIKDLMFDYEMGKLSQEDYDTLLARTKNEAAQLRRQIDRLSSDTAPQITPSLDADIETMIAQARSEATTAKENKVLLREINAEIETLKHIPTNGTACLDCGTAYRPGDAFCSGCGGALPKAAAVPAENQCSSCGHALQTGDAFCAKCGTSNPNAALQNSAPAAVAEPA